jgi:hypothetical protein
MFVAKATTTAATAAGGDPNWAFDTILKFVMAQLERVNRKEIAIATLREDTLSSSNSSAMLQN